MVILENIDIDIDKAILRNIDIDKISNRFKFGISNRARNKRNYIAKECNRLLDQNYRKLECCNAHPSLTFLTSLIFKSDINKSYDIV